MYVQKEFKKQLSIKKDITNRHVIKVLIISFYWINANKNLNAVFSQTCENDQSIYRVTSIDRGRGEKFLYAVHRTVDLCNHFENQ